jgi:uncharacterized OB-fold protein
MRTSEASGIPVVRCAGCGAAAIPPQYACGGCGGARFEPATLPGRARVYSHTTIRIAPEAFRAQAPYTIVLADLAEGLKITARIDGTGQAPLKIGQELSFDRVDESGVYWFRPAS